MGSFSAIFRMSSCSARSAGLPGTGGGGGAMTARTSVPESTPTSRKTAAENQRGRRRGGLGGGRAVASAAEGGGVEVLGGAGPRCCSRRRGAHVENGRRGRRGGRVSRCAARNGAGRWPWWTQRRAREREGGGEGLCAPCAPCASRWRSRRCIAQEQDGGGGGGVGRGVRRSVVRVTGRQASGSLIDCVRAPGCCVEVEAAAHKEDCPELAAAPGSASAFWGRDRSRLRFRPNFRRQVDPTATDTGLAVYEGKYRCNSRV